jgi:protein-glutamine gamma-glutamyltransferase
MTAVAVPRRVRVKPRREGRVPGELGAAPARPLVRVLTFTALGLYGSLRWATLVAPAATVRMLILLGFAVTAGGALGKLAQRGGRSRMLAAAGAVALVLAAFPVCGVPVSLIVHLHPRVIANGLGLGLTALPRLLVPYAGLDPWARTVILLGGAMLLLDAGVLLAFVPHSLGDARRAGAALPLIALAVVPSTLEAPHVPYLQGLLLFVLVAAFVWGERLGRRELAPALAFAGLAGVTGVLVAPRLDIHRPLLNYEAIANSLSPGGIETFQWYQGYGPYSWPTDGQQVLRVEAAHAELWKTQNLDVFDGRGWVEAPQVAGAAGGPPATPTPSLAAQTAWTQTLRVTIGTMYTYSIVAGGAAQVPQDVPGGVSPGPSSGTWVANRQLGPGDAYAVRIYAPNPSPGQLESAGASYPNSMSYYRQIYLSVSGGNGVPGNFVFPAFGAPASPPSGSAYVANAAEASPYAGAYRLARRLEAGATTPYAFVARVQQYLLRNYKYNTNPPISADPIETFLFQTKIGYCQQFAGAMALLLRMGGVPARVAVGFTPGAYSSSTHEYDVVDTDAHAWVEVWFPTYGWVAFNPTPGAGANSLPSAIAGGAQLPTAAAEARRLGKRSNAVRASHRRRGGGLTVPAIALAGLALVLALGGAGAAVVLVRRRTQPPPSSDELLTELERALRRSSFEFSPATTLTELERRFRRTPEAAGYVRAVGRARYAGAAEPPTPGQRRGLRAALAQGRGSFGRIRALWALPPRL